MLYYSKTCYIFTVYTVVFPFSQQNLKFVIISSDSIQNYFINDVKLKNSNKVGKTYLYRLSCKIVVVLLKRLTVKLNDQFIVFFRHYIF